MKNSLKESPKRMSEEPPKRKGTTPQVAKKQLSKITKQVHKRSGNSLLKITPRKSSIPTKSKIHQLVQENDCEGLTKFLSKKILQILANY